MPGTITTDLLPYDAADATTNWVTLGTTWGLSPVGTSSPNADMNIEGTGCLVGRVTGAGAESFVHASNVGLDLTTGSNHIYIWIKDIAWPSTDTRANGGMRITLSSDTTPTLTGTAPNDGLSNGKGWFVDGTDTVTIAGWRCYVIDPQSTPDVTQGTPAVTSVKRIGMGARTTKAVGGGNFKPATIIIDAVRYGTSLTINNGTSSAPVAFTDINGTDNTNAYGILTFDAGIYYGAGKLKFGTASQTAITYFSDSNQVVVFRALPVNNSLYEIVTAGAASFTTTFQLGTYVNSVAGNGCTIRGSSGKAYAAPGAPTVAAAAGSGLGIGNYLYKVTFVNSVGETVGGTESATVTTTSGNQQVSLTAIPTGPALVTARNIYRTTVGGASGSELFVAQVAGNITTTYTDSTADSSLGRPVPTVDSSAGSAWTLTGNAANTVTNLYASTFVQMRRGSLNSSSSMRSCVVTNSGELTPNGAVIDSCTFSSVVQQPPISGTWALIINASSEMTNVTNCKFINCNKAIKITAAGTYAFSGITFSGNSYDVENASTGLVTINVSGGGSSPTYINTGVGASTVVNNTVTLKVTVKDSQNNPIQNIQVSIQKDSSSTDYGHDANPFTAAAGNNQGNTNFVVTQTPPGDLPSSGWIIVRKFSGSTATVQSYRYNTKSGSTFTFNTAVTGTDNGAGNSTTINETGIGAKNIVEGDTIRNTTDGQWAVVMTVSTNSVTTTALSGGATWAGKNYSVHTLALSYTSGTDTGVVPLMDQDTDASGVATVSINLVATMSIIVRARSATGGTSYIPYGTTGTVDSSGYSGTLIMTKDSVHS